MSFRDDVDRVLREEERKNRRTQTTSTKRTARQFEQPTYFAIVYAKMLMRFGRGRQSSVQEKNDIPSKKKVSTLSIIRSDLSRIFSRKKKVKTPKSNESWEAWKDYFAEEPKKKQDD